jgi:hypothetical protein
MTTINKCPFHVNAKRSDMVAKLIEEDYYQPLANGYDVNKDELFKWMMRLTNKEMFEILMTDEKYGICWCDSE